MAEALNRIKDRLGLSVSQLAELFGTTRKIVYDWYERAEPGPLMASRITTLDAVLAQEYPWIDLKRLKAAWKVPVSDTSFLALLHAHAIRATEHQAALCAKLHELAPLIAPVSRPTDRRGVELGEAHLCEFDRRADTE